ncbi:MULTISPECIES: hypothetical protein [Nonomuraea]|uniref:Uncharacterized protein n=1 Tax=Nonomuraea mangrovi TaxID=2316207 RepID=A0ABW4T4K9_9ACTN
MAAKTSRNVASEIAYLTRALKAPSLAASVERARLRNGRTRSFWLPVCSARSQPAKPTAVKAASSRKSLKKNPSALAASRC